MAWKTKLDTLFRKPEAKRISWDDLRNKIFQNLENDKDYVIAVTGDEGEGKSLNAAFNIGKRFWKDFDPDDNIVYTGSGDEFDKKYSKLQRKGVFIIDEAVKLAYKMDFASTKTKNIVKRFTADVRKEKLACHILCIPVLSELVTNFRTHRVKMWIELLDRKDFQQGYAGAIVFTKERNPFTDTQSDPWLLKLFGKKWMEKIKDGELRTSQEKLDFLRSHPYYFGEIVFPKPSDSDIEKYAKYQLKNKKEYEEIDQNNETIYELAWKKHFANLAYWITTEKDVSQNDICRAIGINNTQLSMVLSPIKRKKANEKILNKS